jgi:FtsH-binding integral membrane protein
MLRCSFPNIQTLSLTLERSQFEHTLHFMPSFLGALIVMAITATQHQRICRRHQGKKRISPVVFGVPIVGNPAR